MGDVLARYEFRIWAKTLEASRTRLERIATSGKDQTSNDTYLISGATDKCNAKIRKGLIDIKMFIGEDRKLEQWQPALKAAFPPPCQK